MGVTFVKKYLKNELTVHSIFLIHPQVVPKIVQEVFEMQKILKM